MFASNQTLNGQNVVASDQAVDEQNVITSN